MCIHVYFGRERIAIENVMSITMPAVCVPGNKHFADCHGRLSAAIDRQSVAVGAQSFGEIKGFCGSEGFESSLVRDASRCVRQEL